MYVWLIIIQVWPFSGAGLKLGLDLSADTAQNVVGPRERSFQIQVDSMKEAMKAADLIVEGIMSSGHVWKAPIVSIQQVKK